MRGVYAAAYLSSLAKRFATSRGIEDLDVGRAFDLIVGTSTGAIVGGALAKKIPLERVIELYRTEGPAIFSQKLPNRLNLGLLRQLWSRPRALRDGNRALENALHNEFQDSTLGDIWNERGVALAIPAVELARHQSWIFKTPHLPSTRHRDDDYRLVDVCLASSAAPIYRSIAKIPNPDTSGYHQFLDGGLWANNPVLVALIEALRMTAEDDYIEIFCLGSFARPEGEIVPERQLHRGLLGWKFGASAINVSLSTQEFAYDRMANFIAKHLRRECRIIRFPAGKTSSELSQYLDLDETRQIAIDALLIQANSDVYETLARCATPNNSEGIMINDLLARAPSW